MLTNKESMKNFKRLLPTLMGLALLTGAAPRISAWNGTGHMVVAEIAYDHLSPKTKAAVNGLLLQHRDYGLWMSEMPAGYTDKPRWAFLKAATWPDDIRKTPDDRPIWHYIDLPVAAPGYALTPAQKVIIAPNAQTQILAETALLTAKTATNQDKAVALCWVEHLIGDIHQPLHTTSLFSAQFPNGDKGGNDETLAPGTVDADPLEAAAHPHKLHALWDDLLGATRDPAEIAKIAALLEAGNDAKGRRPPVSLVRDLPTWLQGTNALVQPYVYVSETLPMAATGPEKAEVTLPPGYLVTAHKVANRQITLAGLRLAGTLNATAF